MVINITIPILETALSVCILKTISINIWILAGYAWVVLGGFYFLVD